MVPPDSIKAQFVERLQARYVDSREKTAKELVETCSLEGDINIVIEASGAAATALELIKYLARSSIYVMTGIPGEGMLAQVDAAQIVRKIVRENQVIVGSVNSNRTHFEMALRDMARINSGFDGVLGDMITHRYRLEDYEKAFAPKDAKHIKTVIEVESW
jgi:threonine dehydrogenase-like Zn-dependent dehydrogenase